MAANSCCVRLPWWTVALFRERTPPPLCLWIAIGCFFSDLIACSAGKNHAFDAFVLQSPLNKLKDVCLQEWSSQPKTLWDTWYSWLLSHAHKKRPWQHALHNWQIESPVPFLGCLNEERKVFRHCTVWAPKWDGLVWENSHLGRFCVNPLQLAKLPHGPLKWRSSGVPSSAIY